MGTILLDQAGALEPGAMAGMVDADKELAIQMMSKKKRKLYDRMQYGIAKKQKELRCARSRLRAFLFRWGVGING